VFPRDFVEFIDKIVAETPVVRLEPDKLLTEWKAGRSREGGLTLLTQHMFGGRLMSLSDLASLGSFVSGFAVLIYLKGSYDDTFGGCTFRTA
jgi:hypothetical protein